MSLSIEAVDQPITVEWLREAGFKWHIFERQSERHWLLWLADAEEHRMFSDPEDLGIELAPASDGYWFCWLRSDTAGRYHRFLHVRHLRTREELIRLVEAITGLPWAPENHLWGSVRRPEVAARMRESADRADRRLRAQRKRWQEVEKDDSRGGALPEHLEAYVKEKPNA